MIAAAEEKDVPVIYIQHEDEPGGMMAKGTMFWELAKPLAPRPQDPIIPKRTTNAFHRSELQAVLDERQIGHLVVVGTRTDYYCADMTCRAAVFLGYDVTLVADGHTTVDGAIPAEQIIRHHHFNLASIGTETNKIRVVPHDQLTF